MAQKKQFKDLKPSVIIFICNFDPLGRKLYQYTFEPRCLEEDFPLQDGTKRVFLSTVGENEKDVSAELVCFLKYVIDSTDTYVNRSGDLRIGKIHERIKALKQSRKLEERYMQFEEMLKKERMEGYDAGHKEGHEAGRREGQAEGSMQMWELITRMIADGKTDMIPRLKTDEVFHKEMLKEYGL